MGQNQRSPVITQPKIVGGHKTWCAIFHRERPYCNCFGPHAGALRRKEPPR